MGECICAGTSSQNDTWDGHSDYCPVYMQGRIKELEEREDINDIVQRNQAAGIIKLREALHYITENAVVDGSHETARVAQQALLEKNDDQADS